MMEMERHRKRYRTLRHRSVSCQCRPTLCWTISMVLGLLFCMTLVQVYYLLSSSILLMDDNREPNFSFDAPHNHKAIMEEEFECVAWHTAGVCDRFALGRRLHYKIAYYLGFVSTLPCHVRIPLELSGYCSVRHKATGEIRHVYHQTCPPFTGLRMEQQTPYFQCSMVNDFVQYKTRAKNFVAVHPSIEIGNHQSFQSYDSFAERRVSSNKTTATTTTKTTTSTSTRGIVLQIYPKVMPSVYAIVKLLRQDYKCSLPIELWYHQSDTSIDKDINIPNTTTHNNNNNNNFLLFGKNHSVIVQHLVDNYAPISWRQIDHPTYQGFLAKVYSVVYSSFDEVLFLDSDNFPLRDPTYLFETPEYQSTGALFWKDFWSPTRQEFFIRTTSVLWELLFGIQAPLQGHQFHDKSTTIETNLDNNSKHAKMMNDMEMESGQLIVNRIKSLPALHVLLFFAKTFDEFFHPIGLVHGDKDLFRLAWYFTDTPFHYIAQPPGIAGFHNTNPKSIGMYRTCGVTMVQHDPSGRAVFMHRNAAKLNDPQHDLKNIWDYGENFVGSSVETQYVMGDYHDQDRDTPCCFPKRHVQPYFQLQNYQGTDVERLENSILKYAREAFDMLPKVPQKSVLTSGKLRHH